MKKQKSRARRGAETRKRRQDVENRSGNTWKKVLLGVLIVAVLAAVLALIPTGSKKTVHQLPKVTPPETVEESA